VTSVLGFTPGLSDGAKAPPVPESWAATETRSSSRPPLPQRLEDLQSIIQATTETSEIGALIRESLRPLTEMARQGIRLELNLPPSPARVRTGWLAANEVLRILARRVLENVYDGGVLAVDARLLGDRLIVEMAHSGGTVTAAFPDTYPDLAAEPRFRRVRALLAEIGGAFILERQASGELSVWVALALVPE
jgi:hypothetical protein